MDEFVVNDDVYSDFFSAISDLTHFDLHHALPKMLRLARVGRQISRAAKPARSAQTVRGYASGAPKQLPVFNKESDRIWMVTSALVTIGSVIWLTSPGEDEHSHGHHVAEKVCVMMKT